MAIVIAGSSGRFRGTPIVAAPWNRESRLTATLVDLGSGVNG